MVEALRIGTFEPRGVASKEKLAAPLSAARKCR
jgi:hypothetical protein